MNDDNSPPNALLQPASNGAPLAPKKRGRKQTTWRCDTREALIEAVWRDYENTPRKMSEIGRALRVSPGVVAPILDGPRPEGLGPRPGSEGEGARCRRR